MSTSHHKPSEDHVTIRPYIIGFLSSLALTAVPYYLVTHHIASAKTLLAAILTFAVAQLIIQVVFFLHLGRGPKPRWNLYFFISTIGIILIVVGGSIIIINNLHSNASSYDQTKRLINDEAIYQINGEKTGACEGYHNNYEVVIKNNQVTPRLTVAGRCDTLTFVNRDSIDREITFGEYPQHSAYAGKDEIELRKGRSKTITLSEAGTYQFHDQFQPQTNGSFAIVDNP